MWKVENWEVWLGLDYYNFGNRILWNILLYKNNVAKEKEEYLK